jgi:hypothetical protein
MAVVLRLHEGLALTGKVVAVVLCGNNRALLGLAEKLSLMGQTGLRDGRVGHKW